MSEMTGAEALKTTLEREGVEVIFGVPGVHIMGLMNALYQSEEIRWITTRHEQAAAFMAFGYARTTGKLGVLMVVPGPGAFNACAAIGTAYAASTPLLLLAGQIASPNIGKNAGVLHEVTEQLEVFRPITKWNTRIMNVTDIPGTVQAGVNQLRTGRPRPVEIEIPFDLLAVKADINIGKRKENEEEPLSLTTIKEAAKLLAGAERPVIWAGGGIITADASDGLTRLAEKINAPVVMTPEGKGAISDYHPLSAGIANYRANKVLNMADLVICLGSHFLPMKGVKEQTPGLKIIQVDIDEEEVARNCPVDIGIAADVRQVIPALLEELPESSSSRWESSEIETIKADFMNRLEKAAPVQLGILRDIRSVLDEDSILVPDLTNAGYWSEIVYPVYKPRTYLTASYFATLGFAFPTALGAKVGNPDKQVVALFGDGGFLFTGNDLATAVQYGINVVTIIFNDSSYGATYRIQMLNYDKRYIGTELINPDFVAYARSFGALGIKLSSHEELKVALPQALTENRPVVIEVPVPNMSQPRDIV
ncbi:thiamine pyrophosphate-binding protein [Chloroflexota bacterium]